LTGNFDGNFTGQVYTIASTDTVNGSNGNDTITLTRDMNGLDIDWTMGAVTGQVVITAANGLTINGNGGNDAIALNYANGNPLPGMLHLNGAFTINGLQGANPFVGTTVEIGQSTVYLNYAGGTSPAAAILAALGAGYNGGGWNGTGAGASGAIISTAAAGGAANVFGIGYADSADRIVAGQPANTVEVRFTVMGDTNLDRIVNSTDAVTMARNYLIAGRTAWDQGNFNFDTIINLSDAAILQKNFSATATGSVAPAAVLGSASVSVVSPSAADSASGGLGGAAGDSVDVTPVDGHGHRKPRGRGRLSDRR